MSEEQDGKDYEEAVREARQQAEAEANEQATYKREIENVVVREDGSEIVNYRDMDREVVGIDLGTTKAGNGVLQVDHVKDNDEPKEEQRLHTDVFNSWDDYTIVQTPVQLQDEEGDS